MELCVGCSTLSFVNTHWLVCLERTSCQDSRLIRRAGVSRGEMTYGAQAIRREMLMKGNAGRKLPKVERADAERSAPVAFFFPPRSVFGLLGGNLLQLRF